MFNIVFKRFFKNLNESAQKSIDYYDERKLEEKNFIDILGFIPRVNILFYIVIIFAFYLIFRNTEKISSNVIFGLVISFILVYFLIIDKHDDALTIFKNNNEKIKFLTDIMYENNNFIINFIDKNDILFTDKTVNNFSLHHNPLLVDFFYETKGYYLTNPNNYLISLIYSNFLVILSQDMKEGVNNPFQNLKNAEMIYKECMNSFESILHSLEGDLEKFNNSVELLQSILLNILTDMKRICKEYNQKNGLTTISIPDNSITEITHIEPNDTDTQSYLPNFNYF